METLNENERVIRRQRIAEMNDAYRVAVLSGVLTTVLGIFLSLVVGWLMLRALEERRSRNGSRGAKLVLLALC